jgi:hypothetical protein
MITGSETTLAGAHTFSQVTKQRRPQPDSPISGSQASDFAAKTLMGYLLGFMPIVEPHASLLRWQIGCPHPSELLRMLCRAFVSPLENPLEKTADPGLLYSGDRCGGRRHGRFLR